MRYLDVRVHDVPCEWKLEKVEGELTHFTIPKEEEQPKKGDIVKIRYCGHDLEGKVYEVYGQEVFVYLPITFHPEQVLGERRIFSRYEVMLPALLYANGQVIGCQITNISLSGCQLTLLNPSEWIHFSVMSKATLKCNTSTFQMTTEIEVMRLLQSEVNQTTELGIRYTEMDANSFSDVRHVVLEQQHLELEKLHPSFLRQIKSWLHL